jgi:hypothetical protein
MCVLSLVFNQVYQLLSFSIRIIHSNRDREWLAERALANWIKGTPRVRGVRSGNDVPDSG